MRTLALFALVVWHCGCVRTASMPHIVKGTELAPDNPGHGNTVGLTLSELGSPSDTLPFCTASVVAARWVLTAAHCLKSHPKFVYFNNTAVKNGPFYRPVVKTIAHPDYFGVDSFDLALVEYAPLPSDENGLPPGSTVVPLFSDSDRGLLEQEGSVMLVGYGKENQYRRSVYGKKLATEVRVHKIWDDSFLGTSLMTYQDELKRGACNGDSGGPAYARTGDGQWAVAGVTHGIRGRYFGFTRLPTCDEGMGIYTYVAPFANWIASTVRGEASLGWPWAEFDPPFANALELCLQQKRTRAMHQAIARVADYLEDATNVPMSDCANFATAVEQIRGFETTNVATIAPILPLVAQMRELERLKIFDPNSPSVPVLPADLFARMPKLSSLELRHVRLSGSRDLQNLNVRTLDLRRIEGLSMDALGSLSLLTTLRIEMKGDPRLDVLGALPNLVSLEGFGVHLNARSLSDLADSSAFPRLDMASFSRGATMDFGALVSLVSKYAQVPARKRFMFPKATNDADAERETLFKARFKELGGQASISFY